MVALTTESEQKAVVDVRCLIATTAGDLAFRMESPDRFIAAQRFLGYVESGLYVGLEFHRLIADFVVQGGCPRGDGSGGDLEGFAGELPSAGGYRRGTLALASRSESGQRNGSQFFICLQDLPELAPDYPVLGSLLVGWEVLDRINAWPTGPDDRPQPVLRIRGVERL
jgi:cyclophilin family peptidyl-prolyl cis-trans isomerase